MKTIENDAIQVRFWGVRGSIPCPGSEYVKFGGNTSCVQVSIPDSEEFIIFDSGSGIRSLGEQLFQTGKHKKGFLFVSHAHWDHIQGFPFFRPIYTQETVLDIYFPKTREGDCKRALTTQLTPNHFPVTSEMLSASITYHDMVHNGMKHPVFSVDYHTAVHPVHTAIFRLKTGNKTIIFAPDNELQIKNPTNKRALNQLKSFLQNADVLIHDGNYDRNSYKGKISWGHSAWEDVVDIASECGVKHLFLTHHDPLSTDEQMLTRQELLDQHKHKFASVQFAKEGFMFSF
jgi:phosphoribosyl 1,2-cyclic phosphodiesterase